MDQKKIGSFLKELRKEKGITQEQLAEELGVTGRTVSRWETGNNMPDISLLVDISDFYQVSIPEIIAGERKSETMNEEVKEVAEAMSDYAVQEKAKLVKSIRNLSIYGFVALIIYLVLGETGAYERNTFLRCVLYLRGSDLCHGCNVSFVYHRSAWQKQNQKCKINPHSRSDD